MTAFANADMAAIGALLQDYFDGLYDGDVAKFERVFHPVAHLYSTDGQTVTDLPRADYLELIAGRQSPAAQDLARHDKILSIHWAGPNTALATVNCAIPPRYFTDYLTLMKGPDGWRIVSKSFHTDVHD
ncbi:MAG: nuclear transport factor 2 family protein [Pseudomonadota bacterium]|nr:nuclear transport factor 2 family protein [Pseudomonadota bacterium]MEC8026685.1 nuclear transport factor 2 family protein [Pseudomonadota bacterium]